MDFKYRVFIKYCVFLNSASYAAVLEFDLPLCTHTDTEGKQNGRGPEYISKSSKKYNI